MSTPFRVAQCFGHVDPALHSAMTGHRFPTSTVLVTCASLPTPHPTPHPHTHMIRLCSGSTPSSSVQGSSPGQSSSASSSPGAPRAWRGRRPMSGRGYVPVRLQFSDLAPVPAVVATGPGLPPPESPAHSAASGSSSTSPGSGGSRMRRRLLPGPPPKASSARPVLAITRI